MSVFKRGKVYWFDLVYEGRRIQRSTKLKNKRDAEQAAAAYRTALVKGEVGITERKKIPAFQKAMLSFLDWSKGEHRDKPATHRRYVISSVALLSHFWSKQLNEIGVPEVEQFKTARLAQFKTTRSKDGRKPTKKTIRPATVNRELACLRLVFNHAMKNGIPVDNPIRKTGVKAYQEKNEQTRVLSYEEQVRYLAHSTPLLRDVATVMLETGMRPEEVYRILPENVRLAEGHLLNPFGKTPAARRRVALTRTAREVLARRMEAREGAYLFPHAADPNRAVPKVNNAHDRAVRDSKIDPCRLYDFRHTWATRAAQSGVDLVTLAAMLGHSKINMVMRYAHPTEEHQRQAMVRVEKYVTGQRILEAEQGTSQTSTLIQ